MQLTRTTLRLRSDLKKMAEKYALEKDATLQEILNNALEEFLNNTYKKKAKKLIVPTVDLGEPLDNLTRKDIYGKPDIG